jgi:hypothetical protein
MMMFDAIAKERSDFVKRRKLRWWLCDQKATVGRYWQQHQATLRAGYFFFFFFVLACLLACSRCAPLSLSLAVAPNSTYFGVSCQ